MDSADLLHPDELIRRLRLNKHRCFVITGRLLDGVRQGLRAFVGQTAFEQLAREWLLLSETHGRLPWRPQTVGSHGASASRSMSWRSTGSPAICCWVNANGRERR